MEYKILQIIPANGNWVERSRGDWTWEDGVEKRVKLNKKQKKILAKTHVQYNQPVVCFALVEWTDGRRSVEPMTCDDGQIRVSSDLDGYSGVFNLDFKPSHRVSLARCQCAKCWRVK
jgi:hypothetical protein